MDYVDVYGNPIPLPRDIWEGLHPAAQALILLLIEEIRALSEQNEALIEENEKLRARIEALEEQLRSNSSNSSRPPSSDPPWVPRKKKPPSGRPRGGQIGHPGHHRELLSEEDVTSPHDYYPEKCEQCGFHFTEGEANEKEEKPKLNPIRHQVVELPPIKPEVHEHRQHRTECPLCHHVTTAELPEGVPPGAFGPRLVSLAALLTGRYRISRRDVEELLRDVLGIRISLGGVKRVEELVSKSLAPAVDEAGRAIQNSSTVNMDETDWKEENKRSYLWNANTPEIAVYRITAHRNRETAQEILGKDFKGILGTDRLPVYFFQSMKKWQICLTHVNRNLQKIAERSGVSNQIGEWGVAELDRVFALWHDFRAGEITRSQMQQELVPIRARMGRLLRQGARCGHPKTERTCENIRGQFQALWTFAYVEGVEPTNNSSERGLRPGVRWRRVSFGTQSRAGSRFVERMLTATETCRRQGRNLLEFMTASVRSMFRGEPSPSLLPDPGG